MLTVEGIGGEHLIWCFKIHHVGRTVKVMVAVFKQRKIEGRRAAKETEHHPILFPTDKRHLPRPPRDGCCCRNMLTYPRRRIFPLMQRTLQALPGYAPAR